MHAMKTITDVTNDERFMLMRQVAKRLLSDPGEAHANDPMTTIKLLHDVGKQLLPEMSGRILVPTIYGFPMIVDLDTSHTDTMKGSIERNLYFLGTYEAGTLQVIKRSLKGRGAGACFVDVGAHNGLMSIFAAQAGTEKILAFEPDPAMFKLMQENIAVNKCTNILPFELGLSDHAQTLSLVTDDQNSGATHIVGEGGTGEYDIEVDSLDHIAPAKGISRVHTMLIDVEGHELNVLKGAEQIIVRDKPDLIVEYDPRNQDQDVVSFLKKHNYKLFILDHTRHHEGSLVPFDKVPNTTLMDNLFCFQEERVDALYPFGPKL
jgi:FkbM family methyltransferase